MKIEQKLIIVTIILAHPREKSLKLLRLSESETICPNKYKIPSAIKTRAKELFNNLERLYKSTGNMVKQIISDAKSLPTTVNSKKIDAGMIKARMSDMLGKKGFAFSEYRSIL
jgi:hypothetical protein